MDPNGTRKTQHQEKDVQVIVVTGNGEECMYRRCSSVSQGERAAGEGLAGNSSRREGYKGVFIGHVAACH